MRYAIAGRFIEACDCTLMCPCWIDDEPDEGHCTGLFAWRIEATDSRPATIDGVDVDGRSVVSVSSHAGHRRAGGTSTVLFIDDKATDEQFDSLVRAFSGALKGPLSELAAVNGELLPPQRANIDVTDRVKGGWRLVVSPVEDDGAPIVSAGGKPKVFEDEDHPLALRHTALSHELGVPKSTDVVAQLGERLVVNVPDLHGAEIDVTGRSGMTGRFSYRYSRVDS